jgi:small GTP-binding protein
MEDYNLHYKHIIIGDTTCGKSSYMKMLTKNEFSLLSNSTIGVDFETYYIEHNNKKIKNHIWDTAGQEKFNSIVSVYYKGAHSCIIMFDITNYQSFINLEKCIQKLNDEGEFTKILIGNKLDLKKNRCVSKEEAQKFALKHKMDYVEISVKDNIGVKESFEKLLNNISKDIENKKNFNLEIEEMNYKPRKCLNCIIS